jgi:hypothetical protein
LTGEAPEAPRDAVRASDIIHLEEAVENLVKVGETSTMDIYEIEGNTYTDIQYLFSKGNDDVACIRNCGQITWTTKVAAREHAERMARSLNEPTLV